MLPFGVNHNCKIKVAGVLGQWFLEKIQNGDEDSHSTDLSVLGEEGHSTILLAHYHHYIFWL